MQITRRNALVSGGAAVVTGAATASLAIKAAGVKAALAGDLVLALEREWLAQLDVSTAEQNWSKGRSKIGPLDVMLCEVLRVVPVVHRRDPRCFV